MNIHIVVFDGFDELDAIGPFEVFQMAARDGADCSTAIVTQKRREQTQASNGLTIVPDGVLPSPDETGNPDLLVVPGGGWTDAGGGVRREVEDGTLAKAVQKHWENGAQVASVCTGAMVLEQAGILASRPAVTHHSAIPDLRAAGVEVLDTRVVDTGDVLTAGGITSGIDLALHLISREFGEAIATSVAERLEYSHDGDVATVPS